MFALPNLVFPMYAHALDCENKVTFFGELGTHGVDGCMFVWLCGTDERGSYCVGYCDVSVTLFEVVGWR